MPSSSSPSYQSAMATALQTAPKQFEGGYAWNFGKGSPTQPNAAPTAPIAGAPPAVGGGGYTPNIFSAQEHQPVDPATMAAALAARKAREPKPATLQFGTPSSEPPEALKAVGLGPMQQQGSVIDPSYSPESGSWADTTTYPQVPTFMAPQMGEVSDQGSYVVGGDGQVYVQRDDGMSGTQWVPYDPNEWANNG